MIKKLLAAFLVLMMLDMNLSIAMETQRQQQDSPLTVLTIDGHKIYTAAVQLRSGEIAYFGFEPIIDKDRSKKWGAYRDLTYVLTELRSVLSAIFARSDVLYDQPELFEIWLGKVFPSTANHRQEVSNLLKRVPREKSEVMHQAINAINSGCLGFHHNVGTYIAYISKEPITGFFPFPDVPPEARDLDAYIDIYDDLLMAISSFENPNNMEKFQHRGIFRNPMSMLRKDYQGVGLLIHAFAAYARSEAFPELKFMFVDPDGNTKMRQMILSDFNSDETVGARDKSEITVDVEALKRRFLAANILR